MNRPFFRLAALPLCMALALAPAAAQQPAPSTAAANPAAKTFSQQDLDQLLAPIALYPDALLAQIFMASTYPLEVVEAARWSKANSKLTGKALEDAMTKQTWDPSVKSLTSVPQVLAQMNEKLDWTQRLGDAFLAQQQEVMATVQSLRAKADAAGNLKSNEQMVVKKETQATQTVYVVESPKPDVVYVPTYNPSTVYGAWWYPTPPYYMYPPSYVYAPGLAFATGVFVGAAIWGSCHWGGWGNNNINIDVDRYNNFNRTNISNKNWNHNVEHRRGVAYKDQNVARQYNRGGNAQAAQSREQFRGRAESGRQELNQMDRNELNQRVSTADRQAGDRGQRDGNFDRGASASDRASNMDRGGAAGDRAGSAGDRAGNFDRGTGGASAGSMDRGGQRDSASNRASAGNMDRGGGGFSGVNSGASTRDASSRGSASRGGDFGGRSAGGFSGGGGGRAGGGGRGGRR